MLHRLIAAILLVVLALCAAGAAGAVTPEERLAQVFTTPEMDAAWFTPAFLAQVPVVQMQAIVAQYTATLGEYQRVEGTAPTFTVVFANGSAPSQVVLDEEGRISGFWMGLPQPKVEGIDAVLAEFAKLPGKVSVLVVTDTGVLGAIDPTAAMAVGSTFKLAIVAALKAKIAAGELAWDDVVTLEEHHLSLPTGILQSWPVGTPLTLQTLASLMISISDNTATDVLLEVVGRETVEQYAPLNRPLLATREAFALKNPANSTYLDAYRGGDEQTRRVILTVMQVTPLPQAALFSGGPVATDIEWFFSVSELVNLMAYVMDLPFMSINPGLANPADWQRVAYKGGSEPGVLNLTTGLVSRSGKNCWISATWNNTQALDETAFMVLYNSLISVVARQINGEN